jgi:hypothetical protein
MIDAAADRHRGGWDVLMGKQGPVFLERSPQRTGTGRRCFALQRPRKPRFAVVESFKIFLCQHMPSLEKLVQLPQLGKTERGLKITKTSWTPIADLRFPSQLTQPPCQVAVLCDHKPPSPR